MSIHVDVDMLILPKLSGKIETLPTLQLGRSRQFLGDATMISYLQKHSDPQIRCTESSQVAFPSLPSTSTTMDHYSSDFSLKNGAKKKHETTITHVGLECHSLSFSRQERLQQGAYFNEEDMVLDPRRFTVGQLAMIVFLMGKNPVN